MPGRVVAVAAALVVITACTSEKLATDHSPSVKPTVTLSPSPTTSEPAPTVIRLPALPSQGIAIGVSGHRVLVVLVNLQGDVLERLPGFELRNSGARPGVVLLRRFRHNYILRRSPFRLVPISKHRASDLVGTHDPVVDLPPLLGTVDDDQLQDWAWADLAPNGETLLAQWYGYIGSECQTPIAHMIPVEEGEAAPVTGPASPKQAPATQALGWSRNNRAIVLLEKGYCGTPSVGSGVWAFTSAGHGVRLALPHIAAAYQFRMWGPSSAPSQP
jgi:hypothetical protein